MAKKSAPPSARPAHFDKAFWSHFAANVWEKKSFTLRNIQSDLVQMSESEIFKLLVAYSDRCRKKKNADGFKFYIQGMKVHEEEVLQVLPLKKDKTLVGYHERMEALFTDYCLVCDELLQVNLEKQDLLTDFTSELYRHVGFPNRFSEMGLYLGNYKKTPFGVHVDACGVFSFPVVGEKRFRLWSEDYVHKNPGLNRAMNYSRHKKSSQLLRAGPGDMTYWPSAAWHIAESDGSFSATWSLGVWVDKPHRESFAEILSGLLREKFGTAGKAHATDFSQLYSPQGEVTDLPAAFQNSLEVLQNLGRSELQETFLKSWMKHISLQGFKNTPQSDRTITMQSRLKLRSEKSPLLWQHTDRKKNLCVSFAGVFAEIANSSGMLSLVQALNAGKTCAVKEFLNAADRKENLKTLQKFAAAGAFAEVT